MRKMGVILLILCVYSFPPLHMSIFRFSLRLVAIHVMVLMLSKHHYHILFYIDKLGSQCLYLIYIIIKLQRKNKKSYYKIVKDRVEKKRVNTARFRLALLNSKTSKEKQQKKKIILQPAIHNIIFKIHCAT